MGAVHSHGHSTARDGTPLRWPWELSFVVVDGGGGVVVVGLRSFSATLHAGQKQGDATVLFFHRPGSRLQPFTSQTTYPNDSFQTRAGLSASPSRAPLHTPWDAASDLKKKTRLTKTITTTKRRR